MTTQHVKKNWFLKHLKLNQQGFFTLLLALLLIISAVQTVELATFKEKLIGQSLSPANSAPATSNAASNVQDLPDMAGGC